jgi:hypothetical protein
MYICMYINIYPYIYIYGSSNLCDGVILAVPKTCSYCAQSISEFTSDVYDPNADVDLADIAYELYLQRLIDDKLFEDSADELAEDLLLGDKLFKDRADEYLVLQRYALVVRH